MFILFLLLSLAIASFSPAKCQSSLSNLQSLGEWQVLHENIGISAMHMQLLRNNKVVMFDRTDFGPSNISLPYGRCRHDPSDIVLQMDCTAHSVLYDIATNSFRPLTVNTDTWCSSGSVLPDGTLVQTGGYNDGDRAVRTITPCAEDDCDWSEYPSYLSERRWYATNQILPDSRVIVIGGRRVFNYEFFPRTSNPFSSSSSTFWLDFLLETHDDEENNLYPFVHLLPNGNLFIFANTRAISFDYIQNKLVKEFPPIPDGDPRNYPSSGSSVLLPIDENKPNEVEIMICGGSHHGTFTQAMSNRSFVRANNNCARLIVTDANPGWKMEDMPMARVMGDMLLLPTSDILIINGAELGTAGWENAANPITTPLIYRPNNEIEQRFFVMSPSARPRMYHSVAILLTDGRVLVGGSNPHVYYNFSNVEFPTDLSIEAYSPPYLSAEHAPMRPNIIYGDQVVGYEQPFTITFNVLQYQSDDSVSVNIIAPSFTTHSLAMNQRMVVLRMLRISQVSLGIFNVGVMGPSTKNIAPPGYYLLYVVHAGIPSSGIWVKIQ
ncbi:aldehyde oxidase GLOX-like [Chenopodium quinoa]|uniref:aldehyde oxidase GLOX-like n=1 Tax=Chenopodium quinoa TaxID=63459 RepID=UPI000B77A0BC|nr:aldehyde oxidase GLOX-like [Chenopodium quinoa]